MKASYLIISLTLFWVLPVNLFGQDFSPEEQQRLDSLNAIINNPSSHDTSSAQAKLNLGDLYLTKGEYEKAVMYFEESIIHNERTGNDSAIALTLSKIGVSNSNYGDYEGASHVLDSALVIAKSSGFSVLASKIEFIISIVKSNSQIARTDYEINKDANFLEEIEKLSTENQLKALKIRVQEDEILIKQEEAEKRRRELIQLNTKNQLKELEIKIKEEEFTNQLRTEKHETEKKEQENRLLKNEKEIRILKEKEAKELEIKKAEEANRRDNLQYSIILIALLVLGAGVMALGRISVSPRVAEGLIFFSFLILFEFLLVLADPTIERWSGGAPGIKLLFNAGIAALIFPAHAFFEAKMKGRLVKK